MNFITALALASLVLFAISLQRTYNRVPAKELKRRARQGDKLAAALYRPVAYGISLRAFLWLLIGLAAGGFFVFMARNYPPLTATVASGLLIWLGFVWLPTSRVTMIGAKLAAVSAPAIAKLLSYLHWPLSSVTTFIRRYRPVHIHTGLYDKDDLLELITQQQSQTDSRIEHDELEIVKGAVSFGDKMVGDIMTPRRAVKMVPVGDDLGPIIMDELHASGHSRFPVYDGKEDNLVGTLYLRDLLKRRSGGKVRSIMKPQVFYLHEEQTLYDALQAILKTHHHLFIVVNGFEEYVGVITIEDVLEQIVGKPIIDEFDQYEDLRAVAGRTAEQEHKEHVEQEEIISMAEVEVDDTIEVE